MAPGAARAELTALLRSYALQQAPACAAVAAALEPPARSTAWTDLLLDVFWAVDWELDARRDVQRACGGDDDVAMGGAVPWETARARLGEVLRALLDAGTVARGAAATRLEAPLLGAAQIVDAPVFQRRGIQVRTATYFKQQKYNLLREENEGYAALLVALTTHLGPPLEAIAHDAANAPWTSAVDVIETETPAERDARAAQLLAHIHVLIGCFHLDATRVLDLVLGVFAAHVTHHYPFFLALIRAGHWGAERIATVLGAQFAHYAHADTRDAAPDELYLVAALLVRDELVSFRALCTLLAPGANGMSALRDAYMDALAERSASAGANALTMAAPLVDDDAPEAAATGPTPATTSAGAATSHRAPAHLVYVVRALLACGEFSAMMPFLAQHPWVFGAFPSVTAAYLRIVWYLLRDAVADVSLGMATSCAAPPVLTLTAHVPEPRATAETRFVFCVGDWARALTSMKPATQALPLVAAVGVHLAQDARLLQMLCRMAAAERSEAWLGVLRAQILPAVSLGGPHAALLHEVWGVLAPLSYPERYAIYGEWKHRAYKRPELRSRRAETEREARSILRRVSADNVRASGRSLAKAAHANPTVFFDVVLHQIQSYDNLIEHVVDAVKYLTPLEYDVFSFSVLEALSQPSRERTKSDGTNASLWLKSLAAFAGTLYRKYAIDCVPLLQYLVNRLHMRHGKDLVVLSELVLKMAGVEPIGELSDGQIGALTGGPLLQSEAALALIPAATPTAVLLARSALKKGGARLLRALQESRLALPLLVLMAQQRQTSVFVEEGHVKALGAAFDACSAVLFQYVFFLVTAMDAAAYAELVPDVAELALRFGVDWAVAWHVARPKLAWAVAHETRATAGAESAESVETAAEAPPMDVDGAPWLACLQPTIDALAAQPHLDALGAPFYTTFWQLSLADISVPVERYEQELARIKQAVRDVDAHEPSENLKKSARARLQESATQLSAELRTQAQAYERTRRRLATEKKHWFGSTVDRGRLAQQLVAHCLRPRALLSAIDALYAARMVRLLHSLGTPQLPTLAVYDALFTQHVAQTLFSASENEARNYAQFLQTLLGDTHAWAASEDTFVRDALGDDLPGLALGWRGLRGSHARDDAPLSWGAYKATVLGWHDALFGAFRACLADDEYMRMRNAIVVLNRIAPYFPLCRAHGEVLRDVVEHVVAHEERGDLRVLAQGLAATLRKYAPAWVDVAYFRPLTVAEKREVRAKERAARRAERAAQKEAARAKAEAERMKKEAERAARAKAEKAKAEADRAKAERRAEAERADAERRAEAERAEAARAEASRDAPSKAERERRRKRERREERAADRAAAERPATDDRDGEPGTPRSGVSLRIRGAERERTEPKPERRWGWDRWERPGRGAGDRDRDRGGAGRDRGGRDDWRESNAMWSRRGSRAEADRDRELREPREPRDAREPRDPRDTRTPTDDTDDRGRKRSLADRLGSSESAAPADSVRTQHILTQTQGTPDSKRMRRARGSLGPRDAHEPPPEPRDTPRGTVAADHEPRDIPRERTPRDEAPHGPPNWGPRARWSRGDMPSDARDTRPGERDRNRRRRRAGD